MSSTWQGKTVIGLTGNIATGKSVVRKMLEHLGAYGIDADALSHRAIARGAPGYQPVVDTFGKWILDENGQIDRSKLAKIVFTDPSAMAALEHIVHPLVRQAEDALIRYCKQSVVVVEAIKLIESGFARLCDSIWVTTAPEEVQVMRLMKKRGMTRDLAMQRIKSQPPQEEKIRYAHVVIRNDSTYEDTWKQVFLAWKNIVPQIEQPKANIVAGGVNISRAKPQQSQEIAEAFHRLSNGKRNLQREDVMALFGEKAFLLVKIEETIFGVVGWRVENLVARVDDFLLDKSLSIDLIAADLIKEIENASKDLQCEVALLFLPPEMTLHRQLWHELGYREASIQDLSVRAWQEAVIESMPAGTVLWVKRLREDLVLKPV
ncbi:MAG: dephospho-CoA kinase [Anaerolineales bacterium]